MSIRKLAVLALACALPITTALACGPDFPQNLLNDRKASLFDLPEGTFAFEASRLLPKADDHLKVVEDASSDDASAARTKAEAIGLSADEVKKVAAMRAASAHEAAAAGAGLVPELFEYTLGAIAFKAGDRGAAIAHFRSVLALSPVDRPRRGLWAQYMLGRALAMNGDTEGAIAAYETLRERALSGAADPLGLAIASFGEQARIQWHHGNVVDAVKSYATQAAHGSASGRASLLFVARSLLAHREQLDKALDDPLTQRLLAAYFYARSDEFAQDWPLAGTTTQESRDAAADASSAVIPLDRKADSLDIEGFLVAVQSRGLDHFDGADRLAAGAYRAGRYPLATQLAAKSTTPLAAWVRAKLALRAGDQATAMREYAQAAKGFPVDGSWNDEAPPESAYTDAVWTPRCRVESERGVLALSRDDYLEAMARLYEAASERWPDAAYVAERVLTADELKGFVDRVAPVAPKLARSDEDGGTKIPPAEQIRALLARRLLRVGRDDEALRYFDDPALRKKAMALIAAKRASHAWTNIARAEALFDQAQLARSDGMELIGTEVAPDFSEFDGEYAPAYGEIKLQPADFIGKGEPLRVKASAATPDERYHYRYVAADLAQQAANLLPRRSQAYAALMCEATKWVIDTDPKRASSLYRDYVRQGAHVAWAADFGRTCPQPDFQRAKWLPWKQHYWQTRHWLKHGWPFVLVGFGALVVLVALRRRRRAIA